MHHAMNKNLFALKNLSKEKINFSKKFLLKIRSFFRQMQIDQNWTEAGIGEFWHTVGEETLQAFFPHPFSGDSRFSF